jgi:hypothetical protein
MQNVYSKDTVNKNILSQFFLGVDRNNFFNIMPWISYSQRKKCEIPLAFNLIINILLFNKYDLPCACSLLGT